MCEPGEGWSALWTCACGEVVLECFLCWSVGVKSQDVAEKCKASLFDFSCDGNFFGDVIELVIGDDFWIFAVEGDSE